MTDIVQVLYPDIDVVEVGVEHGEIPVRMLEVGTPGPRGKNGLTAYEVAVENGFVGTEAQWLLSISSEVQWSSTNW